MKSYLAIVRGSFMAGMAYRSGFIFTVLNNLAYMTIAFYLWQSIYQDKEILKGLTFNQTFLYISVASSLFVLLKTWTDWEIAYQITEGSIIMTLIKPINYQWYMMSQSTGFSVMNLISVTIPSILFLIFVFKIPINAGLGFLFFPISLIFSFILNTSLDYITGLTSFYTESIWGISSTKEIIIMFLSGAIIPLQFFPEALQNILKFLPFQALFHIPLMMLVEPEQEFGSYLGMIGLQAFWAISILFLGRLFYKRASKVLRVSGG